MAEVPQARSYRHEACGAETEISGGYFTAISNPFTIPNGTRCTHCDDAFALSEFIWVDTGERISTTLERHRDRAPGWARLFLSDGGCLASAIAGVLVGIGVGVGVNALASLEGWLGWVAPILGAGVGLIGGMMFFGGVVGPFVQRTCFGISDWRELK